MTQKMNAKYQYWLSLADIGAAKYQVISGAPFVGAKEDDLPENIVVLDNGAYLCYEVYLPRDKMDTYINCLSAKHLKTIKIYVSIMFWITASAALIGVITLFSR